MISVKLLYCDIHIDRCLKQIIRCTEQNKMTKIWMFKILRFCIQTSKLFFSSPDLKDYVSYCNDMASLIHKLFIFQPSSEEALKGLMQNLTEMFLTRLWTNVVILMQIDGQAWFTGAITASHWVIFQWSCCVISWN